MISELPRRQNFFATILIIMISAFLMPGAVAAQESDGWDFRLTTYMWMMSMDGTTAAAGMDVPVDASFADILDKLNIAFSANMELNNGKWFVVLDPMYADLELSIDTPGPSGKVKVKLWLIDALVGLKVAEHFDIYTGARYYHQDITVIPSMLPRIGLGANWTDFLLGIRAHAEINEKWSFTGRVDGAVAGDSDSMWWAQAMFSRQIGDNKHLDIGYRYYDDDFEQGSGLALFKWDVDQSGPVVGFSWDF